MARGAWAHTLSGDCINMAEPCMPYKTFTIHTLLGPSFGPQPFYTGGTFCSCGRVYPEDDYGTGRFLPTDYDNTAIPYAPTYGRQPDSSGLYNYTVTPKHIDGSEIYFNPVDLAYWYDRKRWIPSPSFGMKQAVTGPPVKWAHVAIPVQRRLRGNVLRNNNNYENRYNFNFTDASITAADGSNSGGPIYGQTDWLGQLHPGSYFWTNKNLNEPFKAVNFYEESGQSPELESNRQWIIPFCSPMNVRSASNGIIGQYTGYALVHYFSFAFVHFGDAKVIVTDPETNQQKTTKPFLPCDYREEIPPDGNCKKINHAYQLWTLDTHWFMVGTNGIGSPKIGSIRHWFYNDPNKDPKACNPYFYCMHGTPEALPASLWRFNVQFNQTDSTTKVIQFGLTGLGMQIAP